MHSLRNRCTFELGPAIRLSMPLVISSNRDECLNLHWFENLEEAKEIIEAWRRDYNQSRPHMALNGQSPAEFAPAAAGLGGRQQGSMNAEN